MRGWISEAGQSLPELRRLAPVVLAVCALYGPSAVAAATVPSPAATTTDPATAPSAAGTEASVPPGTAPMAATELYLLYRNKSWQWADGAGRMDSEARRFTAWVDGDKGKSWAEGRWLVTDSGLMCLKANWHSAQGVFPGKTCFSHRIGEGTIYQRQEPDGEWYVFRHAKSREEDEARKLVSADLVTSHVDGLKPVRRPKPSMTPTTTTTPTTTAQQGEK